MILCLYIEGLLPLGGPIAPLLTSSGTKRPTIERHFSAFPLTSHLHSASLRLVSRHPSLSINLTFLRVPEIHDGFEWRVYLSPSLSVEDVINTVCEQLGLVKSLPVPGGGAIEYAIEELRDGESGEKSPFASS